MATIAKVLRLEKREHDALVWVELTDGSEIAVWVGGQVETYHYKGNARAFVKKG